MSASVVRALIEAKARKAALDAQVKEVNAQVEALQDQVKDYFADTGVTSMNIDGSNAYRHSQLWASMKEDAREPLVAALRDEGYPELTTINHQSFSAWVRERLDAWCEEQGGIYDDQGELLRKYSRQDAIDLINEGKFDWDEVIPGIGRHINVTEKVSINVRRAS